MMIGWSCMLISPSEAGKNWKVPMDSVESLRKFNLHTKAKEHITGLSLYSTVGSELMKLHSVHSWLALLGFDIDLGTLNDQSCILAERVAASMFQASIYYALLITRGSSIKAGS